MLADSPQAEKPYLLTLGRIGSSDGALDHQHQLTVLLAYLAHCGPCDRMTVATVFWPTANAPLNSLSSALSRIRQAMPGVLETDKLRVATNLRTDALDLLDAVRAGEADAHEAYAGPFLQGFQLKALGLELEEWIFETREMLADVAASNALAAFALGDQGHTSKRVADLAERVIEIASDEVIVENIGLLYPPLSAFGLPGASRLQALAREANAHLPASAFGTTIATAANPGLLGRGPELGRLRQNLLERRTLNLFGIGGAGKSTLARHLFREATETSDSTAIYLELEGEDQGDRLLHTIADRVADGGHAADVASVIAERVVEPTLIVIDDVRQSPSLTSALMALNKVEDLMLLLVSRSRLNVPDLEALHVRGLPLDDGDGGAGPAIRLFRERTKFLAQQRVHADQLDELANRVCEIASGLPLAIELMAAWLRLIPIAEVESLLDDGELLDETPPGEDVSLAGVIEQSWRILPDRAKEALSALSVMRGSFDRESAKAVADVGVGALTDLHGHSLLETRGDGRLRCHPLVQAFAHRRSSANSARQSELRRRHAAWFLPLLTTKALELTGPSAGDHLHQLELDQPNIEAAWSSAVSEHDTDQLNLSLNALDDFLLRSGQFFVAKRLYEETLHGLRKDGVPTDLALAAAVANNLAWTEMLLGYSDLAARTCALGLSWLPADRAVTRVALLRTQCALLGNAGDGAGALAGYLEARRVAADLHDERLHALLEEDIGRAHTMVGDHESAISAFRRTLDAARRIGDPHMESRSYLLIAVSQTFSDPLHALVLLDEGEQIASAHELRHLLAYFPADRGVTLHKLGRFRDAAEEFERGAMLSAEVGDRGVEITCQLGAARAHVRNGDREAARSGLRQGLRASIHAELWPHALGAALDIAQLALGADNENETAAQLAATVGEHPHLLERDRSLFGLEPATANQVPTDLRLDELCEKILRLFDALG